jgi:hypothetical protein
MHFLNVLLGGKVKIVSIIYLRTKHLGKQEMDRKAIFDLYCETETGEKIMCFNYRASFLFQKKARYLKFVGS